MDELFVQLCGSVLAFIEFIKPFLRKLLGIGDDADVSANLLYQGVIKLLALGAGVIGAIVGQVDVTPSWLATSDAVGYLFTGLLASLGSEIGHRILEIVRAAGGFAKNKANAVTVTKSETVQITAKSTHDAPGIAAG